MIKQHAPVIFIEAHSDKSTDILNYLMKLDYQYFWFISERYHPNNYFKQEKSLSRFDINLACFPRSMTPTLPKGLLATRIFLKFHF
ncbi:hypothetical protein [Rodentibacter myodis]|uniref:hypothetical protein n=1 Tax=Rodentibacter myodis TaxID=1907939 RepID=UPI001FC9B368|nr:hypothetical protein [Rodentibacter myodis]